MAAMALPNDPIYPRLLRGAVISGMKLGVGTDWDWESGEWGRGWGRRRRRRGVGEIDNLPIGPRGAALPVIDDETRPELLPGDRELETAGIIILAEQEGEDWDSADSDTAMGAFWVN